LLETTQTEIVFANPIDLVEELVSDNSWAFDRTADDEMIVEIPGRWCTYRLFFVWDIEVGALYFSCLLDDKITGKRHSAMNELLAMVNERLWFGHFDMCTEEGVPMFRHTTLLRGDNALSVIQLEELVDIGLSECDRYYPAFHFVVGGGKSAKEAVTAAMFDTQGEA